MPPYVYYTPCGFCGGLMRFRRPTSMQVFCCQECLFAHESGLGDKIQAVPVPPEER